MADFSDQKIENTSINGLFVIKRPVFSDKRGFFREVVRIENLEHKLGIIFSPKQWNHSMSKPGTLRGLHAENWNKIIYPITGKVFIAVADLRPDSDTFAKVETFVSDENERFALFISKGLANSFCNFGEDCMNYLYLVDAYYDGSDMKSVAWNDPDLNIDWPVKDPILSEKDRSSPTLRDLFPGKFNK